MMMTIIDNLNIPPKDWRPVPDPTVMTTQQLTNAINCQRDLFETRLQAIDESVSLLHEITKPEVWGVLKTKIENLEKRVDHKYVETAADIGHLRDLHSEKIKGIEKRFETQFIESDKRHDQLALADSTAITTALQAQKEAANETQKTSSLAITKSETATADSIKQLQALFQEAISGLNTQVLDVKSRLDKGEGQGLGDRAAHADHRMEKHDSSARMFAIIAIVISALIGATQVWNTMRSDQINFAKNSARTAEKSDVDILIDRMNSLSDRLNGIRKFQTPAN